MQNDKNSLCYWWPRVADVNVPKPKTIILPFGHERLSMLLDGKDPGQDFWADLFSAGLKLGYPLFMRTDHSSAKHQYVDTCYVRSEGALENNVWRLIEMNALADVLGLPYEAIVLREFIPLASRFTAFGGSLPIAPERRYFVRDGRAECRHAYWPAEAIERVRQADALPCEWRGWLDEMNCESDDEVSLLSDYACLIGNALPGYWSVDFAKAADGRWIFIDSATGERSWHPEHVHEVMSHA